MRCAATGVEHRQSCLSSMARADRQDCLSCGWKPLGQPAGSRRSVAGQAVVNQPVIFIHGNSDSALGTVSPYTGWTSSISYFKSQGYTSAELYATTWGPADSSQASLQYHSKAYMTRLRAFIQA